VVSRYYRVVGLIQEHYDTAGTEIKSNGYSSSQEVVGATMTKIVMLNSRKTEKIVLSFISKQGLDRKLLGHWRCG
jgi:hypothetical protein